MLIFALMLAQATNLPTLPKPTPRQLAWQRSEANAFVHFGPNTFTDVEWGGGKEDPKLFHPSDLDCDQWVRTFKAAGFQGVILTAKHHDGFCLWPSRLSTHTVAQSGWKDGKGDVLRELSDACKRQGMRLGIYLSPWDRNHPAYGTPKYNQIFAAMLTEVLTQYGPIFEVWFDGANGEGPNGKKQVYDWPLFVSTVRKHQPNAVIFSDAGPDVRWVGNEGGIGGETCWSTVPSGRYEPGTPFYQELTEGKRDGDIWVPAEMDTSIRPGWFYHADQDSKVRTPDNLLRLYETSVGRNGVLLLNVPPDRRGQIAPADVKSLAGYAALRKQVYGRALAQGTDRSEDGATISLKARRPMTFDRIDLREQISDGQRVASFVVEVGVDGKWREIGRGTTVGARRILPVATTTADSVRVRVTEALAPPKLLGLRLYRAGAAIAPIESLPDGGSQATNGSLTIEPSASTAELGEGSQLTWRFQAVRGEVRVELEAEGQGRVEVAVGGETRNGTIAHGGVVDLGKVAVVVGGASTITVRVIQGTVKLRAIRLRPLAG